MKKILIVDDSLFMRKVLTDILSVKKDEYEIFEADSGKAALTVFHKEHPNLILLDIIMPEGEEEGVRVLRNVMETDPEARVIMITAVGQELVIKQCKQLGAKDYLVKPFDEDQVLKTVEKHLSR